MQKKELSQKAEAVPSWTEFETFYDVNGEHPVIPIVAMANLTQLKENGAFVDKWMGFFHDSDFYNYKTILTFDDEGNPQWSVPEKYFQSIVILKNSPICVRWSVFAQSREQVMSFASFQESIQNR